ncbi:MAG: PDZ domain-containing protein [Verrucomicrobiae bacterium]|nr:PDZ domain-containing protein [Verrucomicrobiae bacterium]
MFCALGVSIPACLALELPPEILAGLASDRFRDRESSEAELLAWARQRPDKSASSLLEAVQENPEPEVRERCLAVLKELVDDEYLRDGRGYIGILMRNEAMLVPGDERLRRVIRIIQVVQDSAAEKAGLRVGDVIAGTSDMKWYDGEASEQFGKAIQAMKPRTKVELKLLRDNKPMDVVVVLGRRPPEADAAFMNGNPNAAMEAAERAREAFFEEWLKRHKAAKDKD